MQSAANAFITNTISKNNMAMREVAMVEQETEDVFVIERNYRSRARVRRSRAIREMRREEACPNGRKIGKRIRKYEPVYAYSHYRPDQPWDVLTDQLVSRPSPAEESLEENLRESGGLESFEEEKVQLIGISSSLSLKQAESMSRETICDSRTTLYVQTFTGFSWSPFQ